MGRGCSLHLSVGLKGITMGLERQVRSWRASQTIPKTFGLDTIDTEKPRHNQLAFLFYYFTIWSVSISAHVVFAFRRLDFCYNSRKTNTIRIEGRGQFQASSKLGLGEWLGTTACLVWATEGRVVLLDIHRRGFDLGEKLVHLGHVLIVVSRGSVPMQVKHRKKKSLQRR